MSLLQQSRKILMSLLLVLMLTVTTACGGAPTTTAQKPSLAPPTSGSVNYGQLERGNTTAGQDFGSWVVQTAKGMVQDAYVRDNNKLGVVISQKVRPNEVKDLAKSLVQGFHHNFPSQDLTVLMYAPDKQLILTAKYDQQSKQVQYQ